MSMDVGGITSMLNQVGTKNSTANAAKAKADGLTDSVNGLSSESTEEELKGS